MSPSTGTRPRGGVRPDTHAAVAEAFREEWGRVVATLIRTTKGWDIAEECAQQTFERALETWPRDGVPRRPGAWLTHHGAQSGPGSPAARRRRSLQDARGGDALRRLGDGPRCERRERGARRQAASDLHLLPPGTSIGGKGRPHAQDLDRTYHRRDSPRVPRLRYDHGPAARQGQTQDPQRRHPLSRAPGPPSARAHGRGARRAVPAL